MTSYHFVSVVEQIGMTRADREIAAVELERVLRADDQYVLSEVIVLALEDQRAVGIQAVVTATDDPLAVALAIQAASEAWADALIACSCDPPRFVGSLHPR